MILFGVSKYFRSVAGVSLEDWESNDFATFSGCDYNNLLLGFLKIVCQMAIRGSLKTLHNLLRPTEDTNILTGLIPLLYLRPTVLLSRITTRELGHQFTPSLI